MTPLKTPLERELVRLTPVVRNPAPVGEHSPVGTLHLKLENLQRTGSFKLRGAARKIARLSDAQRNCGVITASAGNHGLGVAIAGQRAGVSVTVMVPEGTPRVKRAGMAALGADVRVVGADYDTTERHALAFAAETGQLFVSPYDDDDIMAGNGGSLAEELWQQVPGLALVVCPVGGGGLIGGMARNLAPRGVRLVGVQPAANCAMFESLRAGRAITAYNGEKTLAEGLEGSVAERTYRVVKEHVERIALVDEHAIIRAVAFAYRQFGTIIECSSAVALAGFLEGQVQPASEGATVCVLTGSNIDPEHLDSILSRTG